METVNIPASEVAVGMQLCIEYAPGREAEPMVREVIDHEDGTRGFHLAQFGLLDGYRDDEYVTVLA